MRIKHGLSLIICIKILGILILGTLILVPALSSADVLKTPGENARLLQLAEQPKRGTTKQQVETRFGAPLSRRSPVGDPPISRWDYERYSVFFEHNLVLHSVVHYSTSQVSE